MFAGEWTKAGAGSRWGVLGKADGGAAVEAICLYIRSHRKYHLFKTRANADLTESIVSFYRFQIFASAGSLFPSRASEALTHTAVERRFPPGVIWQ